MSIFTEVKTLKYIQQENVDLLGAIQLFTAFANDKNADAMVFLYSPKRFLIAKLIDGDLKALCLDTKEVKLLEDFGKMSLAEFYQVRFFNNDIELRWFRPVGAEKGSAIILSEDFTGDEKDAIIESVEFIDSVEQRYLLWGEWLSSHGDWTVLAENRIGSIAVPVEAKQDNNKTTRVQCVAKEYLGRTSHGNIVVIEERLVGLESEQYENGRSEGGSDG